jgi:hypothetical protein
VSRNVPFADKVSHQATNSVQYNLLAKLIFAQLGKKHPVSPVLSTGDPHRTPS